MAEGCRIAGPGRVLGVVGDFPAPVTKSQFKKVLRHRVTKESAYFLGAARPIAQAEEEEIKQMTFKYIDLKTAVVLSSRDD